MISAINPILTDFHQHNNFADLHLHNFDFRKGQQDRLLLRRRHVGDEDLPLRDGERPLQGPRLHLGQGLRLQRERVEQQHQGQHAGRRKKIRQR